MTETDQEAAEVLCEFFKEVFVIDKDDVGDTTYMNSRNRNEEDTSEF